MASKSFAREVSAGAIVGLSAVIYSLSYGALLFSGNLAPAVGYGIAITLITATLGAFAAWLLQERSFLIGPDSNTISVAAGMLATLGAGALSPQSAVGIVIATSLVCAVSFYVAARTHVASLVRYIPFAVMAGFLAGTGWLMSSGAMNIIAGTPLTSAGVQKFFADPVKPELLLGIIVAVLLLALAKRVSSAVLIPVTMLVAAVFVKVMMVTGICGSHCEPTRWLFGQTQEFKWLPPWELRFGRTDLAAIVSQVPGMLIVAFVGLLTILLSVASLELTYQREFELESVLRAHAGVAVVSGALGGFTGVISIGRTALNRQMGGGAISATIAGVICLATLMGGGGAITYIPKAALGGLVLFIGIGMLRQWLWDQRTKTTAVELSQILLIVGLVAKFGFLVGFAAGILIACVVFVVTYSRIPVTGLSTTLANFPSTVVRPDHEAALLHDRGHGVLVYRLHGYMFFGSASAIDAAFRSLDKSVTGVIIDFSDVSGVDSSAVGVFQRILRRFQHRETPFAFVYSPSVERGVRAIISGFAIASAHSSLDSALEAAEERIVSGAAESEGRLFSFLPDAESRQAFAAHCERRTLRRGETLCLEGDHSAEVFFVDQGSLEVFKQGDNGNGLRLAKLRAGAMVGEQAFYTGEARTASIAAAEDSIVYALGHEELERLRRTHPEVAQAFDRMVITKLSHALARTNRLVAGFR